MTCDKRNSNPLDLSIGQRVLVNGRAYMYYDESNNRLVGIQKKPEALCYVLQCVRRAEGKYVKGCPATEWGDYEQAQLKVSKYVHLYVCAESLTSKSFLVHPSSIYLGESNE